MRLFQVPAYNRWLIHRSVTAGMHLEAIDFLGPVPAELFERFEDREARGFHATFNDALAALGVFALDWMKASLR